MSLKNLNVLNKTRKYLTNNLRDKKIFQIYKKFENNLKLNQNFIVAVSGGPDSMALSYLTKIYSIKKSLKATYFIVDHRLRKNSSLEALSVKNRLKRYNINASILKWSGTKPTSNIQSLARSKRYSLLIKQAKKSKVNNILTGHHIDDLYENFFLRIARGSGLNGLVSLTDMAINQNINIIRPLLIFDKSDLVYLATRIFNSYVNDPFNEDDNFKRSRIRKLTKSLHSEGLDKKKLLLTIKNLKDANETIKFYIEKNLRENLFFNQRKKIAVLNLEFFSQPHEIIFRSLTHAISFIGNRYYPPRGKKIERIIDEIKYNTKSRLKHTLGNCIIHKVNHSIIVSKEHKI